MPAHPGVAAASRVLSRVVEPTRGLLGTSSGQPGGAKHPGDRAVEHNRDRQRPTGVCVPSGNRQRPAGRCGPPGGPAAASRTVRPIRGLAAASRAVRPTRGTERWITPGDRQWSAGRWSPPRDRQRSAGRCGPPGGPSGIAQPGTGSDQRAVRPIRGPVAASRALRPTRGTEWYSLTGDRQRPAGGAAHPGDRAV